MAHLNHAFWQGSRTVAEQCLQDPGDCSGAQLGSSPLRTDEWKIRRDCIVTVELVCKPSIPFFFLGGGGGKVSPSFHSAFGMLALTSLRFVVPPGPGPREAGGPQGSAGGHVLLRL